MERILILFIFPINVALSEPMPNAHRLILISGEGFHEDMRTLSQTLSHIGRGHTFLDRPDMKHHWDSGWIEQGLTELLEPDIPDDT